MSKRKVPNGLTFDQNSAFETPLDPEVIKEHSERRMERLDQKDTYYSPIDTPHWSPSGSTTSLD